MASKDRLSFIYVTFYSVTQVLKISIGNENRKYGLHLFFVQNPLSNILTSHSNIRFNIEIIRFCKSSKTKV